MPGNEQQSLMDATLSSLWWEHPGIWVPPAGCDTLSPTHTPQTQVRGPGCLSGFDKGGKNNQLKKDSRRHWGLLWTFRENLAFLQPGAGS